MDGKDNLPVPLPTSNGLIRPIDPDTTSSSSSSSSSFSSSLPQDFARRVQADLKRRRPLGNYLPASEIFYL